MSQNSPETYKTNDKIIDLAGFFIEILRSWKFILLLVILITVLFSGISAFINRRTSSNNSGSQNKITEGALEKEHEKKINEALNKLTSAQAKEVEDIYDQYQLYMDHRAQYQKDFAGNLKASEELENDLVVKRVSYVFTSSIEFAETLMSSSLTIDDYKAIKKLLPEVKDLTTAYNYVSIWSNAAARTEITNFGPQESPLPISSLIVFEVVGNNKDVCDKLDKIVDKALQKEKKKLQAVDNDIKFSRIDEIYRGNVLEYIAQRRQTSLDNIQKIDQAVSNFKTYTIEKLTLEQKEYFYMLKDPEYGLDLDTIHSINADKPKSTGSVKNLFSAQQIMIGILLGLIISVCLISIRYLIDETIKARFEIEEYYHLPLLNTYFMDGRRKGIFNKLIRKLLKADDKDVDDKTELIAVDICGIMKNINADSLYIIKTTEGMEDRTLSKSITKAVIDNASDFQLMSGIPFLNANELRKITKCQNALILVHTKETLKTDMEEILSLCWRHSINVIGAVAIVDC